MAGGDGMTLWRSALPATMVLLLSPLLADAQASKPPTVSTADARSHASEVATVCGTVDSARFLTEGRQPTFLDLDGVYPKHLFTVLIWGVNRSKFGKPEETYLHKRICVTGTITIYRDAPQMIVDEPRQLVLQPAK
jgi:hypothetical protein